MTFAEKLKQVREERKLTMDALADAAGISPEYVSMMEAGRRVPSFIVLGALAEALKMEISDLMKGVAT